MGPNFLCIGTYRAGTTWLYRVLKEHPDIFLPDEKELMFFSHHYDKGVGWYEKFFEGRHGQKCAGDISPTYLSSPQAAARIYRHFPDVKLIVSLRNPPEQVYSLYKLWLARSYTDKDIGIAIEEEKEFLDNILYWRHLSRYLEFFDRENILVLFFEDLKEDPKAYLKQVYGFLGVEERYPESIYEKYNQYRKPRNMIVENIITGTGDLLRRLRLLKFKSLLNNIGVSEWIKKFNTKREKKDEMPKEVRSRINEYIKDDKRRLEEFVGRDLSFWR
ncbi:hypothetical protein MNBD_NITROSPIRAE02-1207 [hydrothermal vent metagenome]|uniref:Sulfotransferase domain-containing protein n=1 Tax=hydrothermal vent metagenome TaxID=652676 RepID=A0A3B1CYL8_9ZZZZ